MNKNGKIAIRVSNHLPIKSLMKGFSGFMISTSANISGEKNINNPDEIINFFEQKDMAYYDESLGKNLTPSKIIDLETRDIIRE
jgi:tRNA A37 threonylcarbamoyladenosine synthetase subunit TsaC/SUA5/YrdC